MLKISLAVGLAATCACAQSTPYYITDGDASTMWVVQNGVLQNQVVTGSLLYPPAIQTTVWLGDRDDLGATEFTLAGIPTGNVSAGGNAFTQVLDGTTDGANNYGVECCGAPNSVTIANTDWSGQQVLFNLPGAFQGVGITYAASTNTLFVMDFTTVTTTEYDLNGNVVNSWGYVSQLEASMAWEAATDTLWTAENSNNLIRQYDLAGNLLQTITVAGVGTFGNIWGGEMPLSASCFADCNNDGVLNILDFVCFQALFQGGGMAADCNNDGVLNILDFVCFQAAFQAGCT